MAKISMKKSNMKETVNTTKAEKSKVKKSEQFGQFMRCLDWFYEDDVELFEEIFGISVDDFKAKYDAYYGGDMWKSKTKKSNIKKSGFLMHREGLNLFKKLIDELKAEGMDDAYGFDELYAIYEGCIEAYNEMVEEDGGPMFYKSTKDMIKALKKMGYKVVKDDGEPEEAEDTENTEDVATTEDSDDTEDEIDKSKTKKSPTEILKSYGWVRKTDDKGPDSEEVEDGAGVKSDVKVPETPEPSDNVQDTKTGIPEDDALIEDGKKNEKMGNKEGDDIDALEEDGGTNKDLPKDMDDIDALIEKKRQQNGYYNGTPAPAVGSTQPYANNYRTTRMGEGKMDVMSQLSNPKTMTSKSTKSMTGSRKSQ